MTGRVWLLDNPRLDKSHVRQIPPSAKPCRKIQNGVLIIRARYGLQPVDTIQILTTLGKNCIIQVESQLSYLLFFFSIYKQTKDEFFDCFPKISKDFRKISEDSPKVDENPDSRFRTFPNIFEDCQMFPK